MKIITIHEVIFKDVFFGKEDSKCFSTASEMYNYIKDIYHDEGLSLQDAYTVRTYVIKEETKKFSDLPKEIKK